MRRGILIILVVSVFCGYGQTKKEQIQNAKISTSKAIKLGRTKPVKELVKISATDRNKKKLVKGLVTAAPENFIGRKGSNAIIPELEHQGPDPIRQKTKRVNGRMTSISPDVNRDGLFSSFGSPNDPSGSVGLDYYVQAINATDIAVYDKSDGNLVDQFSANTLWGSLNETSAGDPIILFDHEYNRWVITEFTSPQGTASFLFAISLTSDPLGSYDVYVFTPPSFPDYPKWSIWKDHYGVTTNESGPGALHQYFFDRAAFLAGESQVTVQRVEIPGNENTEAGFYVSTPVSWIGDTPPADASPIAVKINDSSWGEVEEDVIELFTFDVDLTGATTITKTSIETTPFDGYPCDNTASGGFSCLSQGGDDQGIDGIPEVIMNLPQYRNFETHESIVLSFMTDVTDGNNLAGVRWMELRRTTGDWILHQEGTYAPDDGLHRFMSSMSMDKDGNIGMAYNTTSDSEFVGVRFTGRYAEDPLGTMTVEEFSAIEGTGSVGGDRFGDYAHMSLDPQDQRTFWYTSEYATSFGSRTRILAFHLEDNSNDLAVEEIGIETSASLSDTESVTTEIVNLGAEAATNFDISLFVNDVLIETYTHSESLASGEELAYAFVNTVDFSALGHYSVRVEVAIAGDELESNNVLVKNVKKLAETDASVAISGGSTICNESTSVSIKVKNEGFNVLESANVEVSLNGVSVETIPWTGSVSNRKSDFIEVDLTALMVGDNTISAILSDPNGISDEIVDDNESSFVINYDPSLEDITLNFVADDWPEENSWTISDSNGDLVASGGPYLGEDFQTIIESICVDPNGCYEFKFFDSFGDGICCGEGNGSYFISDENGVTIFESDGLFSREQSTSFCLGTECNLAVTVDIVNATTSTPGSLVVEASGSYNYEFSADGGTTFQESPVFDELDEGTYDIVVQSQDDNCTFEESITVGFDCTLSVQIEETKNGDGTGNIEVIAAGGDVYEYSIDGGSTFQSSNIFSNLASGTYEIQVRSNDGVCLQTESYTVDFVLGISIDESIKISPNPTSGVFTISVPGHDYIKGFLEVEVLDLNGRIVQNHRFSRFDDSFEGTISLYAYPNGVYFLKMVNAKSDRIIRVLKQ